MTTVASAPPAPSFIDAIRARAARRHRRIVFPETADMRVRTAVDFLAREGIVEPIVLLDPEAPETHVSVEALGVETIDPVRDPRRARTISDLLERRAKKGLSENAAAAYASNPLFFADGLVRHGDADGCVAGCVYTTGDVLRAALWLVGTAPGVQTVSSAFYMVTSPFRGDAGEVLTFTDCAVIPYPTSDQLADIALAAAADRRRIVGDEPCVAMLSFSTAGSAGGASVDLVRDALEIVRAKAPTLAGGRRIARRCGADSSRRESEGSAEFRGRARERSRVPVTGRRQHCVQAGRTNRARGGDRADRARARSTVQRPFARSVGR